MPAIPQQMSDTHDKSDDLIAELAKLMASGASAGEGAPKPSVIKLPPLNQPTAAAAPVRIPGMNSPGTPQAANPTLAEKPASPVSVAPPVRIPGMERPAGVTDGLPTAPTPRPGSQFDFGKPPAPTPIRSEPMPSQQPGGAPKPTAAATTEARPEPASPPAPPQGQGRLEPVRFGAPQAPIASGPTPLGKAPPATPQPKPPAQSPAGDFDFKFDLGETQPHAVQGQEHDDPIADLIAAELLGDGPADRDAIAASEDGGEAGNTDAGADHPRDPVNQPHAAPPVQMKPSPVSARQPETDRFTLTPTFSAKPAPAPAPASASQRPSADEGRARDPIEEIESLIGEAVRVELDPPTTSSPPPANSAPVVPPLSGGFGPRRSGLREKEPQVDAAEAAILAAATASGAQADIVEEPVAEGRPYKRMKVKPPRTSGFASGARQYIGIAVAATLFLAAGFGLYWVLAMGNDDPATAPLLTADASPVKVEPAVPARATEPASGSVVFDEIDGVANTGENETLVSRDETAGASVSEVARVATPGVNDGDDEPAGLANRKVRTVTVRPDGTIVSSDDTVAGTAELPVERPNVPEIPGATTETPDLLAAVAQAQADAGGGAQAAMDAASSNVSALVADAMESTEAALAAPDAIDVAALSSHTPAVFDGSLVAPRPMPRPSDRTNLVGAGRTASVQSAPAGVSVNQPASTPLTSVTQQQPAPTTQASGGAYVQLSSQRTESDASASLRAVQSRLGGLLDGPLEVRRVDLGAKGIWYRVVMPTSSFQNATQSCATIKANGGDCVAING